MYGIFPMKNKNKANINPIKLPLKDHNILIIIYCIYTVLLISARVDNWEQVCDLVGKGQYEIKVKLTGPR